MEFSHRPVILEQTISSLDIKPNGIYLDGTAGGGGHSAEILKRLGNGRLICVDQDPDAIEILHEKFGSSENAVEFFGDKKYYIRIGYRQARRSTFGYRSVVTSA